MGAPYCRRATVKKGTWSKADLRALQAYWPHCSGLELAKLFGGRYSSHAIRNQAIRLGLKKDASVADQLRRSWNREPSKTLQRLNGRGSEKSPPGPERNGNP